MAKKKKTFYVSMYELYPIFEPAEGGYYYNGVELCEVAKFRSYAHARNFVKKYYGNLFPYHIVSKKSKCCKTWDAEEGSYCVEKREVWKDETYVKSPYIGEGAFITIEPVYGSHRSGWTPYC